MVDSRQQVDSVTVNHCQPLSTTVNLKVIRLHVPPLSTTVNHEVDRSTEVDSAHRSTGSTGRQGHDGRQGRQQGLKLTTSLCAFTHRECKVQGCQDIVPQANHMIRAACVQCLQIGLLTATARTTGPPDHFPVCVDQLSRGESVTTRWRGHPTSG